MTIDLDQILNDINILNAQALLAKKGYQVFMDGEVGGVKLTPTQKTKLKTNFTGQITAARDAAQAVLDGLTV